MIVRDCRLDRWIRVDYLPGRWYFVTRRRLSFGGADVGAAPVR